MHTLRFAMVQVCCRPRAVNTLVVSPEMKWRAAVQRQRGRVIDITRARDRPPSGDAIGPETCQQPGGRQPGGMFRETLSQSGQGWTAWYGSSRRGKQLGMACGLLHIHGHAAGAGPSENCDHRLARHRYICIGPILGSTVSRSSNLLFRAERSRSVKGEPKDSQRNRSLSSHHKCCCATNCGSFGGMASWSSGHRRRERTDLQTCKARWPCPPSQLRRVPSASLHRDSDHGLGVGPTGAVR
jgi:hypothetical protein